MQIIHSIRELRFIVCSIICFFISSTSIHLHCLVSKPCTFFSFISQHFSYSYYYFVYYLYLMRISCECTVYNTLYIYQNMMIISELGFSLPKGYITKYFWRKRKKPYRKTETVESFFTCVLKL